MFRKVLIVAMFATAAGYCFAADKVPQIVTSEVFYTREKTTDANQYVQDEYVETEYANGQTQIQQQVDVVTETVAEIPTWPIAGSDADVTVSCEDTVCENCGMADKISQSDKGTSSDEDNIRVVSKIGDDMIIENNFNLAASEGTKYEQWSGGANLLHGTQIPVGFDDECANGSEMPLLHREMLEDDGGEILTVSRSGRKNCSGANAGDAYLAFANKMGMRVSERDAGGVRVVNNINGVRGTSGVRSISNMKEMNGGRGGNRVHTVDGVQIIENDDGSFTEYTSESETKITSQTQEEIAVDISADAEPAEQLTDQVRSWVVANGQTLREILQKWCDKEGWDLVWTTSREYPIEASAVFKGRFVDVASALVRNFGRATPVPYAKFYKGNRVLVISTSEE